MCGYTKEDDLQPNSGLSCETSTGSSKERAENENWAGKHVDQLQSPAPATCESKQKMATVESSCAPEFRYFSLCLHWKAFFKSAIMKFDVRFG